MNQTIKELSMLLIALTFSFSSFAYDVCVNGIYYNLTNWEFGLGYDGFRYAEVTANEYDEFHSNYVGNIIIPKTITVKGVSYSVTHISDNAFGNCPKLTSVTIPSSVTFIGSHVFNNCPNLKSINVERGNPEFDSRNNCNAIIKTSTNELLCGCKNTIIPKSVTSVDIGAFYGSGLVSVTIPSSITKIGFDAFRNCPNLTSINVERGNQKYDSRNNCNAIIETSTNTLLFGCKNTTIPNTVTSIHSGAFYGSCLTSVTIPNSIVSISGSAFDGCPNLTSINVEDGNPKYDSRNNCNAIIETSTNTLLFGCKNTTIPNTVTNIGDFAFSGCSNFTSVIIPNSVTSIGRCSFESCSGLTSVVIPKSIASISEGAFEECPNITSINVEDGNPKYDSRNNCNAIIETSTNTLILGCKNTSIPDNITSIGGAAFDGCSGLTSVTIPNSVTNIAASAFSDCSGLTSVTIPNSVTNIAASAFSDCSGLTSVTIPNSVTNIGDFAFSGCSGLTSMVIPISVDSIGASAFSGCSRLISVTIPNSVSSIGDGAFEGCENLKNIYCYAKKVPEVYDLFGEGEISSSLIFEKAILYVPVGSIQLYRSTEPWNKFGSIKSLPRASK